MNDSIIKNGVVHKISSDIKNTLLSNSKMKDLWNSITPLARNEWICWIESAKRIETKDRRLGIMKDKLLSGEKRPCCWAGCMHR